MGKHAKPSRLFAATLAFVGFVTGFSTLALVLIVGAAFPAYGRGELDAGQHQDFDVKLAGIAAVLGLFFAVNVYRVVRQQASRSFIFHGCFLIGLTLLGYSLWAVLELIPITQNAAIGSDSPQGLQAALSGPVLLLFVIPVALLFLIAATVLDNNRNS